MSISVETLALAKKYADEVAGSGGGGANPDTIAEIVKQEFPGGVGYITGTETVEILPEETVTLENMGFASAGTLSNTITLEVGKTYTVIYNGTQYECECAFYNNQIPYLGDAAPLTTGSVDNIAFPFMIMVEGSQAGLFDYSAAESATVSVTSIMASWSKLAYDAIPWEETSYKEPLIITSNPDTWTTELKEKYFAEWQSGRVMIYHGSEDKWGTINSMWYGATVGMRFSFVNSKGILWTYGSDFDTKWGSIDLAARFNSRNELATKYYVDSVIPTDDHINSLIDAKLDAIPIWTGGSY